MDIAIGRIDGLVLALYLLGVVALGTWVGRGTKNLNAYLLGGRSLPWWAILGSIIATETSTATFLSIPGISFARGGDLRFLQITFGYVVGRLVIVFVLLPLFFRGHVFTAYEVLNQRFGASTKKAASLIFLVTRNLGDGLRLFLTAIALEQVLGWSMPACVVLIGMATIAYTVFGGMKSVIWIDCIQMLVYLVGGIAALSVIASRLPGGFHAITSFAVANEKFQVLDFRWTLEDPFTFWAGLIGGMFLTLGTHGTDQMMVQRYLCSRSLSDASRALSLSGFAVALQFLLFLLLGVGLAAYYDHFGSVSFERSDQVFASFIVSELPSGIGLIGLLLAAVFAAAMSTLSSSLNSSASSFVNDLYRGTSDSEPSEAHLLFVSRLATVAFGGIQIMIGIAAAGLSGAVVSNSLAIAGFASGLLLGVFALGIFTREVNQAASLVALSFGLLALLIVQFVLPVVSDFRIAWPWLPVVGGFVTFASGVAVGALQSPRVPKSQA